MRSGVVRLHVRRQGDGSARGRATGRARRHVLHFDLQLADASQVLIQPFPIALAQALLLKVAQGSASHAREELALALAIILLGFLMMIVRRNAVTQVVGFMSMENGLILAATGARGMPLVVEVSVAFSVLIALFVFAVFVFRIRERFDTVDIEALDRMRGDRR